jgi:transcription elongation factor Elf1
MTIQRAIDLLAALKKKHGDVEVYFDCPECGKSSAPSTIIGTATMKVSAEALARARRA